MKGRYLSSLVEQDLDAKMVFVSGPRQSRKTTLARHILSERHGATAERYLNWDDGVDRYASSGSFATSRDVK